MIEINPQYEAIFNTQKIDDDCDKIAQEISSVGEQIFHGFNAIEEIDKTWEMIMKYSTFLDSECLSLLSRLQSGGVLGVFRALRGIYRTLKNGVNIEGIENEFVTIWHFVQVQDDYYNRVFASYKV